MDIIDNAEHTQAFHEEFQKEAKSILEPVREALIEGAMTCTREEIVAQVMMENLFPHPCDPENDGENAFDGRLTGEQKIILTKIANHMGPDWAQALYHVAVFITKVA